MSVGRLLAPPPVGSDISRPPPPPPSRPARLVSLPPPAPPARTPAKGGPMSELTDERNPRRIAGQERDRLRFEEEALELADHVYRVARRLVSTREEAEDLVQETYARAFRAWRSYTPGTNLRAWLPPP